MVQEALFALQNGRSVVINIPARGGSVRTTLATELEQAGLQKGTFFFRSSSEGLKLHITSPSAIRVDTLTSPLLTPPVVENSPYLEIKERLETEEKLYELLIASKEKQKHGLAAHLTFPPPPTLATEWDFFQESTGRWVFLPTT